MKTPSKRLIVLLAVLALACWAPAASAEFDLGLGQSTGTSAYPASHRGFATFATATLPLLPAGTWILFLQTQTRWQILEQYWPPVLDR
jgi:hypothetical protein